MLSPRFRWWADAVGLHGGFGGDGLGRGGTARGGLDPHRGGTDRPWWRLAPAWGPASVGVGSLLAGATLRLDVSPTCLLRRRHARALEAALDRAGERRRAVTYDELALAALGAAAPTCDASAALAPSGVVAAATALRHGRV